MIWKFGYWLLILLANHSPCLGFQPNKKNFMTFSTRSSSLSRRKTTRPSVLMTSSSGPKTEGSRRTPRRNTNNGPSNNNSGPKSQQQRIQRRERPPEQTVVFNGKAMTAIQVPNENAPPLDLESFLLSTSTSTSTSTSNDKENNKNHYSSIGMRCMTPGITFGTTAISQPAFSFQSLDDLFGPQLGFSKKFNSDQDFRQALRAAIRQDIFDTTPFYSNLSEKAKEILLLPDSSLEGSWRINQPDADPTDGSLRMKQTTKILKQAFAASAHGDENSNDNIPTGDDLFQAIGSLCGTKPSTHWIDIYGVQDRKVSHSWHLDFGASPDHFTRTVLWGFPSEDNYHGCGVFSHVIALQYPCLASKDQPRMEPVLFDGTVDETYIVRPKYEPGKELLMYRDIDVLHSAPDVTYRTSVMRFM